MIYGIDYEARQQRRYLMRATSRGRGSPRGRSSPLHRVESDYRLARWGVEDVSGHYPRAIPPMDQTITLREWLQYGERGA